MYNYKPKKTLLRSLVAKNKRISCKKAGKLCVEYGISGDYSMINTICNHYAGVNYYSETPIDYIPATNGFLLPLSLFE